MSLGNFVKILIFLFVLILLIIPVSARWIQWVNCDDLFLRKRITPQQTFNSTEKICFYGSGFSGETYTIRLRETVKNLTRILTVPVNNEVISSVEGYSLSSIEPGVYTLMGLYESNYVCSNQDGQTHCIPEDKNCTFWKFKGDTGRCGRGRSRNCEIDFEFVDPDTDGDSWSDSCDAFPNDASDWIDIDGDGSGNNKDVDDFNILIISEPIIPGNNESGESGTGNGAGGGSGSGGNARKCAPEYECTDWSVCINGRQIRECWIINDCIGEPAPLERNCIENTQEPAENEEPYSMTQEESVPDSQSQEPPTTDESEGMSLITGAAVVNLTEPRFYTGVSAIFIIISIMLLWIKLRKSRS